MFPIRYVIKSDIQVSSAFARLMRSIRSRCTISSCRTARGKRLRAADQVIEAALTGKWTCLGIRNAFKRLSMILFIYSWSDTKMSLSLAVKFQSLFDQHSGFSPASDVQIHVLAIIGVSLSQYAAEYAAYCDRETYETNNYHVRSS